ncbi:CBS domain-containing protein [Methanolobus sp. ZRKC2]|uniref:CBS domain-containing protein n=1 Tax=Methanolobus sp. ZRKC2 TaxID=3125783 RepID=UPI0032542FDB
MDYDGKSLPRDSSRLSDRCKSVLVSEIMSRDPVTVMEDDSIDSVIEMMTKNPYHIYPVTDKKGKLVGIIGQDNILKFLFFERIPRNDHTHLMAVKALSETAGKLMIQHPMTVDHKTNLCDVGDLMIKHHLDRICVVRDEMLLGVVSKSDVIKEIHRLRGN